KTWDGRREQWHCGRRDNTLYVGSALLEIDDDPRRCIWAHPVSGQVLRVEFPDVPLDHTLRLRGAIDLRGTRYHSTDPVDYRIFIDDELIVERTIDAHDSTWYPHDLDTSSRIGELASVAVEVEAKNVRRRHFCFNGWVLDEDQAQRSTRKR
ncbi:MAG: hypothetical protein ACNA8W_20410, partial [Bradymonadaceae bacterium]